MQDNTPRLLVTAHGTASLPGADTTTRLVEAVRRARPGSRVDLCFLDVLDPRLADSLDERPTVVVPLLLSTGYHVGTDIPAAVAGRPAVRVARHLGPHPLLLDALVDRLGPVDDETRVVLVGAGSSRPEARDEQRETGRLLGVRLRREVPVATVADDLEPLFANLAPVRVATYLLTEGRFVDTVRAAVAGHGSVSAPIGVHPALVELVWKRYDAVLTADRDEEVR